MVSQTEQVDEVYGIASYCKWLQILITETDLETGKLSVSENWSNLSVRKYIFSTTILKIK